MLWDHQVFTLQVEIPSMRETMMRYGIVKDSHIDSKYLRVTLYGIVRYSHFDSKYL
jgi:hypothetical protein